MTSRPPPLSFHLHTRIFLTQTRVGHGVSHGRSCRTICTSSVTEVLQAARCYIFCSLKKIKVFCVSYNVHRLTIETIKGLFAQLNNTSFTLTPFSLCHPSRPLFRVLYSAKCLGETQLLTFEKSFNPNQIFFIAEIVLHMHGICNVFKPKNTCSKRLISLCFEYWYFQFETSRNLIWGFGNKIIKKDQILIIFLFSTSIGVSLILIYSISEVTPDVSNHV